MPTAAERRAAAAARERWRTTRRAETAYAEQLRRIARAVGDIVRGIAPDGVVDETAERSILDLLNQYSTLLRPWAAHVGQRMIEDVATRNFRAWMDVAREMGVALRREITSAPTGEAMRAALASQVDLIQSIPREAAERVHHLTTEARISGRRAESIAREILETGDVTRSRAETIARTETGRTATELTKARSLHIGSEYYIWWAVMDADTRKDHVRLHGKLIHWNNPPIVDRRTGRRAHAGADINCRCIPKPVLDPSMFELAA